MLVWEEGKVRTVSIDALREKLASVEYCTDALWFSRADQTMVT